MNHRNAWALALAMTLACDLEPQVTLFVEVPDAIHVTEMIAACDGVSVEPTAVTLGEYLDDEGDHVGWSLTIVTPGSAAQAQCLRGKMLEAGAVETWTDGG